MDSLLIKQFFFLEFPENTGQIVVKQRKRSCRHNHGNLLKHIKNLPDIRTTVRCGFQKMLWININIFPAAFLQAAYCQMGYLRKKDAEGFRFIGYRSLAGQKQLSVSADAVSDFQPIMKMKILR